MSYLRVLLLCAGILFFSQTQAAWNITQSYITLNSGAGNVSYAGSFNPDAAALFNGQYYGNLTNASTLVLDGGQLRSIESGSSNVCGGVLFYRVYRNCDVPGAFIQVNLATYANLGGGNESWTASSLGVNLLSGLPGPGTYVIEAYWRLEGNATLPAGCGEYVFDNNAGSNWRGFFDYTMTDSFSDNNFSAAPVWSGDTGNFQVVSNSDVAALTGTEVLQTRTLRLNVPTAVVGTQSLSTPISTWLSQQEWSFWLGRRAQAATAANRTYFWLYANEADLESATVDGYRLFYGDDSGGDEIHLEVVTNGVGTVILTSTGASTNGITDFGFTVKVTRDQNGGWVLYSSALPTANGTGKTANSCPGSESTVLQGSVTNTLYTPTGTGYIGVSAVHSSGAAGRVGLEIDNVRFSSIGAFTEVSLAAASGTANENDGTYTVVVNILNPSGVNATNVNLVLISGNSARVNGFTTQAVVFPAGSSAPQNVVLTLTDNALCDDIANLVFQLQGVSGGNSASITSPSQHALTIIDDDMGYATILTDDFEDNNINGWVDVPSGYWGTSNFIPCSGVYSARSGDVNVAGLSSFTHDLDQLNLDGKTVTWKFNLRYSNDPSPNNKFLVYLGANESDVSSATVDGYAVGVNPVNTGDPDIIALWEVTNGVPGPAIVTTLLDWGTPYSEVGFKVTRDETGNWELFVDETGDFDNLVSHGTGVNTTYHDANYFGVRYQFTAGLDNALAFDDISITEKGCRQIYYSQASGNVSAPIWDTQPVGVGGTIYPGSYTRLVIQNGHTVSLDGTLNSDDISIANGAVLNGGSYDYRVHGAWINDGTFNANTGTITFKGAKNQLIAGSAITEFHDLRIDNDGFTVTVGGAGAAVNGRVLPEEGTLNANGLLTLLSKAGGTASIAQIKTGADVTGNLTLQRFVPSWTYNGIGWNSGGTWVNLGNSMGGALTLSDWNDDMITTGFPGADYPPPYSFVNITQYDESVPGPRNNGFVNATNITNPLVNDDGYFVFLTYNSHTFDATGTIQKNSITHTLDFTNTGSGASDGWNLLTNRYPSEVDWDALVTNGSGVSTFYVYDRDLPGYRAYNGLTQVGTGSRYLPSGQSFMTFATSPGGFIQYQESYKTNTNQAFERSTPESSFISLRLEKDGLADESVLVFRDGTSDIYEAMYDAEKLDNGFVAEAPELALMSSDDLRLTIYSTEYNGDMEIPVWIDAPSSGSYTLLVNETNALPQGACLVVEDVMTGIQTHVENGMSISFELEEAFSGVRFVIHASGSTSIATTDALCNGDNGSIEFETSGDWNFNVTNEMGESVFSANTESMIIYVPAGTYFIEYDNVNDACGAFAAEVAIAEPETPSMNAGSIIAACNVLEGSIEFSVNHAGMYNYQLLGSEGSTVVSGTGSDIAMVIENLPADQYELLVETTCETFTSIQDLRDPAGVEVQIDVPAIVSINVPVEFTSETVNAETLSWSVDGNLVAMGETMTTTFISEGVHSIELIGSNATCTSTHGVEVVVNGETNGVPVEENTPLWDVLVNESGFDILVGESLSEMVIVVFNAGGQLVMQRTMKNVVPGRVHFENGEWSAGAYSLRISNGVNEVYRKTMIR